MQLSKLGVWAFTDHLPAAESAAFARRVEGWGYSALWIPEAVGRNALVQSGWLLAATQKLIVATGIANIYARDPMTTAQGQKTLAEQSDGRFLLGLGVSHVPLVEGVRGHSYGKPVAAMRSYLEAMAKSMYLAPQPAEPPPLVIAALGPKMLELAAELTDGAHPYLVTPEHTAEARRILGPDKWLCVEQKLVLSTDPARARAAARKTATTYLALTNYRNNLLRLGFANEDFENAGSHRLIDAIVAWGDEAALRARIQAHWDAGADHVCIQALHLDEERSIDEKILQLLAPGS